MRIEQTFTGFKVFDDNDVHIGDVVTSAEKIGCGIYQQVYTFVEFRLEIAHDYADDMESVKYRIMDEINSGKYH